MAARSDFAGRRKRRGSEQPEAQQTEPGLSAGASSLSFKNRFLTPLFSTFCFRNVCQNCDVSSVVARRLFQITVQGRAGSGRYFLPWISGAGQS
jgi:hypothetical protein